MAFWSKKDSDDEIRISKEEYEDLKKVEDIVNDKIKEDPRVEKVILPLRDGLTMIWKK